MRRFPTTAMAIALAAAFFYPSSVQASPACGDFLLALARKPPNLAFIECGQGRKSQLRVLIATYRVRGVHASQVENYFNRNAKMAKLRFYCCGWEPDVRRTPPEGQLRNHQKVEYEMTMESEETIISVRKNWNRIQWFYVSVTLFLEEA